MNALILDTETHDMNGYPIEIAHVPCDFNKLGVLQIVDDLLFGKFYSCPEPISFGAMAVHHIIESDLIGKPSYNTFRLPQGVTYLIGHNIDYDIKAIQKCDNSIQVKGICTLALSRMVWPDAPHNLSALYYMIAGGTDQTRKELRNAHNAAADIMFTATILRELIKLTGIKDMQSLYLLSEKARIPTKMTFGKHSGMLIKDVPADYKTWLLKQSDLDPYLRKALEA